MKEVTQQSWLASLKAVEANGQKFFGPGGMGGFIPAGEKEKRNKIAIPATMEVIKALNSKIEKVLKMTQTNENFYVNDSLTYADIDVFAFKLCLNDPIFNKYGDIKTSSPN